ncbi:hypothetical protein JHK87_041481 [Glycine soja]|nr:hypothetical protein JHK87_041481 [Glycine soja]
MAETRCLAIIDEEEIEVDDDIYENIEAPKFVDLTAPDSRRPDDDRHWFCFRVGCDQKHEQELDSEAIYKNFVLRVMAARSPNVRLRKALNRREASANLKCPLTAPAKSRVSRTDFISSLSHKMTDNNVKVKPLSKALTTPRNHQKKVSNVEQFRSVQSKKALTVEEWRRRNQKPTQRQKDAMNQELQEVVKGVKKKRQRTQFLIREKFLKPRREGLKKIHWLLMTKKMRGNSLRMMTRKIEMSTNDDVQKKKAILGSKHEDLRKTQKKSTSTSTTPQVLKYRKLKPTSPKPFKLRTDERGILKEANLDRKIPSSLKETTVKGSESKAMRKYQNAKRTSETCSTKSEQVTDNYSSCDEKSKQTTQENKSGSIKSNNSNCKVQRKLSATTPHRNPPGPKLQKAIDQDDNFKRKSQMMQRKIVRPRRFRSQAFFTGKEGFNCSQGTKVSESTCAKGLHHQETHIRASSPTSKTTGSVHRPFSRGRKDLTVPKEPKFQNLQVPKDCWGVEGGMLFNIIIEFLAALGKWIDDVVFILLVDECCTI